MERERSTKVEPIWIKPGNQFFNLKAEQDQCWSACQGVSGVINGYGKNEVYVRANLVIMMSRIAVILFG